MLIVNCTEFASIQEFLDHALLKQQEILDGEDEARLQELKDINESKEILHEFKHSQKCHAFYRGNKTSFTARKPTRSKPSITTKDEVFYYYLTSKQKLAKEFYSLSKDSQKDVRKDFNKSAPTSSKQAMNILSILLN